MTEYISPDAFTIHMCTVPVRSNESVILHPFGCVHRHSPAHSDSHWQEFLTRCKTDMTSGKKCLFLGMGDYDDLASASERITIADLDHESTQQTLDDFAMVKVKALCKELEFMRGNIVGMIEGNHYWKFQDGTTSTQKMCDILKCKYLGTTSVVTLALHRNGAYVKSSCVSCTIFAHHGNSSNARTPGGSVNSVEQMREVFPDCDIYIAGHDHKRWAVPLTTLHLAGAGNNILVKERQQWLIRSGSFLRAYIPNKPNYISRKAKAALDLGTVDIEITYCRHQVNNKENSEIKIRVWQ